MALSEQEEVKNNAYLPPSGKEMVRRKLQRFNFAFFKEKVINTSTQTDKGGKIELSLFDDVQMTLRSTSLKKNNKGVYVWRFSSEDLHLSQALICFNSKIASGVIQVDHRIYEIVPVATNIVAITEYDQTLFPACGSVVTPQKVTEPEKQNNIIPVPANAVTIKILVTQPQRPPSTGVCSQSSLDVQSTTATEHLNGIYNVYKPININTDVTVVCVDHFSTGGDLTADLEWLSTDTGIKALRDQYKADLVTYLSDYGDTCGLGYLPFIPVSPDDKDYAFSVVKASCALGSYSLAHELGHNLGMRHDRIQSQAPTSPDCNFGSIFQSVLHIMGKEVTITSRSIMAYGDSCSGCKRVGLYSSPMTIDLKIGKFGPCGVACSEPPVSGNYIRANNLQQLITAAPIVSKYR